MIQIKEIPEGMNATATLTLPETEATDTTLVLREGLDGILCMPLPDSDRSRIWLRVCEDERLEQVIHQLEKLVDVVQVRRPPLITPPFGSWKRISPEGANLKMHMPDGHRRFLCCCHGESSYRVIYFFILAGKLSSSR